MAMLWLAAAGVATQQALAAGPDAAANKAAADKAKNWSPPPMPAASAFSSEEIDPEVAKRLDEEWGVEVLGLRMATGGYMLDFRFRVNDVDKALPLFDSRITPYAQAAKSDVKLPVPMGNKVGSFRTTNRGRNIKAHRNYAIMFGNPDRYVEAGERVTIVVGDFRVENLLVN